MRSIALALLLLAAPTVLAAPPPEARARKEQGDRLRKGGDLEGATRAYQSALQLDGGYAEAHEALGEVFYASKQVAKAIQSFGDAVEIDPTYALAWYNLAFAARRSGDHARARTAYEKYVKLRPTDPDGHYGLAETQRALGNRDAAVAEYQLFIDLAQTRPDQAAWVEKARAAQAELRRPSASPPVQVEAPAAAKVAPATSAASPGPAAALAAGAAGAAVGEAVVAAPLAASPVPVPVPPPSGVAAPPAAPVIAPAAPVVPVVPVVPVAVPAAEPSAVPSLARAPAPPTPAPPSRALIEKLGAGDRAYLSGDHRAALFAYQDAIYLDPTSAVARIKAARAYSSLGHREEAERQLRQALELDPGNEDARKALQDLGKPQVSPSQAPAAAVQVISPPAGAAPQPLVFKLTDDAGTPAPAEPAPAGAASEASHRYKAALAMIEARDFKGAVIELDRALQLNPRLGEAAAARASAFYGLGRYRDAARDYEAALALAPQLATPLFGLAETYRQLGDPRAGEFYARYAASAAADVRPDLRDAARRWSAQLEGK